MLPAGDTFLCAAQEGVTVLSFRELILLKMPTLVWEGWSTTSSWVRRRGLVPVAHFPQVGLRDISCILPRIKYLGTELVREGSLSSILI